MNSPSRTDLSLSAPTPRDYRLAALLHSANERAAGRTRSPVPFTHLPPTLQRKLAVRAMLQRAALLAGGWAPPRERE